jgi:hypothetical protein
MKIYRDGQMMLVYGDRMKLRVDESLHLNPEVSTRKARIVYRPSRYVALGEASEYCPALAKRRITVLRHGVRIGIQRLELVLILMDIMTSLALSFG